MGDSLCKKIDHQRLNRRKNKLIITSYRSAGTSGNNMIDEFNLGLSSSKFTIFLCLFFAAKNNPVRYTPFSSCKGGKIEISTLKPS